MKNNLLAFGISLLISGVCLISCIEDEESLDITDIKFTDTGFQVTEGLTYNLDDILQVIGSDSAKAQITFESSDVTIVSVDGTTLTALAVGTTKVTATESNSGLSASADVEVVAKQVDVTGVSLDKETADLKVGETLQLTATITPADATEQGLTWSVALPAAKVKENITAEDIATVSNAGLVTAKAAGEVVVTAKTKDGDFTASITIIITNVAVTGVEFSSAAVDVVGNKTAQLVITISPDNATVKDVTYALELNNEGARANAAVTADYYASIDEDGVITGKKACNECILAVATTADGGFTAKKAITITYVAVTSITLNPTSLDMLVDNTQQMTATIAPADATDQEITWSIENINNPCRVQALTTYAEVSETGLVTATYPNSGGCTDVKVVATTTDVTGEASINIKQLAESVEIKDEFQSSITEDVLNISSCDDSYQLTKTVLPQSTSDQSVTWSYTGDTEKVSLNTTTGLLGSFDYTAGTVTVTATANDDSGLSHSITVNFTDCK